MIKDIFDHGQLQCNAPLGGSCSLVEQTCDFMNQCSGHGKCNVHGFCECEPGYFSADCSILPEEADEDLVIEDLRPREIKHYHFDFKGTRNVIFRGGDLSV